MAIPTWRISTESRNHIECLGAKMPKRRNGICQKGTRERKNTLRLAAVHPHPELGHLVPHQTPTKHPTNGTKALPIGKDYQILQPMENDGSMLNDDGVHWDISRRQDVHKANFPRGMVQILRNNVPQQPLRMIPFRTPWCVGRLRRQSAKTMKGIYTLRNLISRRIGSGKEKFIKPFCVSARAWKI